MEKFENMNSSPTPPKKQQQQQQQQSRANNSNSKQLKKPGSSSEEADDECNTGGGGGDDNDGDDTDEGIVPVDERISKHLSLVRITLHLILRRGRRWRGEAVGGEGRLLRHTESPSQKLLSDVHLDS